MARFWSSLFLVAPLALELDESPHAGELEHEVAERRVCRRLLQQVHATVHRYGLPAHGQPQRVEEVADDDVLVGAQH